MSQVFPAHWNVLPFSLAVKDATSKYSKLQKSEYLEQGKFPIVDQGQKKFGGYTDDVSVVSLDSSPAIVFGDHTRILKFIDEPFCLGADGAKVLEPTAELDKKFLFYYLSSLNIESAGYSRHFKFLKENVVPVPPLDEQKRIAAILDKADAIRRKRQQAIQLADDFLRAVFLEMFGDPVTNPKGWEIRAIDELCLEIVDCVNRTAPTVDGPTPYKMIRTTNVRNYTLDTDNVRYVDEETYRSWVRRLTPEVGDIVFTREAPAGEAAVIRTNEKIFLGQRTMHFRPDHMIVSSEYLLFELMGSGVKSQINKMHAGSTVTHLSVPECKKFKIRVPPLELQMQFESIRDTFLKVRKMVVDASDTSLFESVSQKAFSGQL